MKRITDYQIVGSSKRCLVLDINGQRVFCSTRNYADLCMNPDLKWEVTESPEHRTIDQFGREKVFHNSFWVVAYVPRMIWLEPTFTLVQGTISVRRDLNQKSLWKDLWNMSVRGFIQMNGIFTIE